MKKLFYPLLLAFLPACDPQPFPAPGDEPGNSEPLVHRTIAQLQDMAGNGGTVIRDNILVSGLVIADDRTGNLYKQVIIEDGTAAIPVLVDAYNLFTDFPAGRKVYIHCRGLTVMSYNKLPQLGYRCTPGGTLMPIPWKLLSLYITAGSRNNQLPVIKVSMEEAAKVQKELLNRLVLIPEAQVTDTSGDPAFALDPAIAAATNIRISDCKGNSMIVRTSGYCSFRSAPLPKGRGALIAVYSIYNSTPQLIIRDTSDLQFTEPRCF